METIKYSQRTVIKAKNINNLKKSYTQSQIIKKEKLIKIYSNLKVIQSTKKTLKNRLKIDGKTISIASKTNASITNEQKIQKKINESKFKGN